MIVDISKRPEFIGKILFLQNYDIALAQKLLQGVDIWLNTPTRPLEASGTSGEKAVMNGCLHLSVLDGWWAEGYREGAGWALEENRTFDNQDYQDELDAETIYSLLEHEIAPLFYDNRDKDGVPQEWVAYIKRSIAEVAPEFTMKRMLNDYQQRFYTRLYERSSRMKERNYDLAKEMADWKRIMLKLWDKIRVVEFRHPDISRDSVDLGEVYEATVVLELGNLSPDDVGVELVIPDYPSENGNHTFTTEFEVVDRENGHTSYRAEITPDHSGTFEYAIRIYARHPDLPHRQDFALVKWT
jgi:phosphorylase/glycogen(starch) synthase